MRDVLYGTLEKKMLRFASDWRICTFVCNSHFHVTSRDRWHPTYVNFQSFHANSSSDFFYSLALNTKNQFNNCIVEPHWEVGRVCSCKSWSVAEICRLFVIVLSSTGWFTDAANTRHPHLKRTSANPWRSFSLNIAYNHGVTAALKWTNNSRR